MNSCTCKIGPREWGISEGMTAEALPPLDGRVPSEPDLRIKEHVKSRGRPQAAFPNSAPPGFTRLRIVHASEVFL